LTFLTATDRDIARLVIVPMCAVFVIAASLLVLDKMLKLYVVAERLCHTFFAL
jgi:lipopolysaccharide export system permease protein